MSHVAVCSSCDLCVIYRLAHVVSKHTWYSQGRLIAEAGRWSEGSWTQSPGLPSACCPPETQSGPLQRRTAVSRNLYSAGAASCLRRGNTLPVFVCKSFHCLCLSRVQHITGVSEIIFFFHSHFLSGCWSWIMTQFINHMAISDCWAHCTADYDPHTTDIQIIWKTMWYMMSFYNSFSVHRIKILKTYFNLISLWSRSLRLPSLPALSWKQNSVNPLEKLVPAEEADKERQLPSRRPRTQEHF